jgi:hypothetical protein
VFGSVITSKKSSKRGGLTVGCLGHNFKEKSQVLSSFTFQKIKII